MKSIQFESFSWPKRNDVNEDSILTGIGNEVCYFGVADGVGGSPGGSFASKLAVLQAEEILKKSDSVNIELVFETIRQRFQETAITNPNLKDMATTFTFCIIKNGELFIGHVGDTRLFVIRNHDIFFRTTDQTLLQELVKKGSVNLAIVGKRYANILSSVLSASHGYTLETKLVRMEPGDKIVICSDGVYKRCSDTELLQLLIKSDSIAQFVLKVKAILRMRGIEDDSSLICFQYLK